MPDLNSLPPSSPASFNRAMSSSANADQPAQPGESTSPSPRASISLQAAALMNAGLQHEPTRRSSGSSAARNRQSPHSGRRRSQVLMNLQLNDPSLPGPGEMVNEHHASGHSPHGVISQSPQPLSHSPLLMGRDPHHNRAPSLGELHQELEAEQEAQVNRLLGMIRSQQLQLQQLQAQQSQSQLSENAVVDSSDRSGQSSAIPTPQPSSAPQSALPHHGSLPRSPGIPHHTRSSLDQARADLQRRSRTPSRGASPRMRATSISGESEQWILGGRDESAFYQAETQMLVRENQMLRHRLRELEKQLADLNPVSPSVTHEPSQHSNLTHSASASEEGGAAARAQPAVAGVPPVAEDAAKEE